MEGDKDGDSGESGYENPPRTDANARRADSEEERNTPKAEGNGGMHASNNDASAEDFSARVVKDR